MKITVYFTLILLATGCFKVECPAYPEKYLNWIPYKKGDVFDYTDGRDTFQVRVDEVNRSNVYMMRKSWFVYQESCKGEAHANLSGDSVLPSINVISLSGEEDYVGYEYNLFINQSGSNFGFNIKKGSIKPWDRPLPIILLSSYDNGYKTYLNVLKLEKDTLLDQSPRIDLMYIAESVGIIQMRDRKNHKTWNLIGK